VRQSAPVLSGSARFQLRACRYTTPPLFAPLGSMKSWLCYSRIESELCSACLCGVDPTCAGTAGGCRVMDVNRFDGELPNGIGLLHRAQPLCKLLCSAQPGATEYSSLQPSTLCHLDVQAPCLALRQGPGPEHAVQGRVEVPNPLHTSRASKDSPSRVSIHPPFLAANPGLGEQSLCSLGPLLRQVHCRRPGCSGSSPPTSRGSEHCSSCKAQRQCPGSPLSRLLLHHAHRAPGLENPLLMQTWCRKVAQTCSVQLAFRQTAPSNAVRTPFLPRAGSGACAPFRPCPAVCVLRPIPALPCCLRAAPHSGVGSGPSTDNYLAGSLPDLAPASALTHLWVLTSY